MNSQKENQNFKAIKTTALGLERDVQKSGHKKLILDPISMSFFFVCTPFPMPSHFDLFFSFFLFFIIMHLFYFIFLNFQKMKLMVLSVFVYSSQSKLNHCHSVFREEMSCRFIQNHERDKKEKLVGFCFFSLLLLFFSSFKFMGLIKWVGGSHSLLLFLFYINKSFMEFFIVI